MPQSTARAPAFALASLLLSFAAAPAQDARPGNADRPPNVVFVLADDLGWGELGCYGQQRIRTPNLDRLAQQGMRLLRHYAGSPVCAPSRCVLLTGRHPGHAAIRDNREIEASEGQEPLPAAEVTLAEALHARGYATGAFGKWGLGGAGTVGDPLAQGFDAFFGYLCQRHAHSHWPAFLYDGGERVPLRNEPPVPGSARLGDDVNLGAKATWARFLGTDYAPDRIQERALAFVRAHREEPFFCYVPSTLPHLALHAPADAVAAYDDAFAETPYRGDRGYTPCEKPRATYAAMISRLDDHVGQLMALLDELGLSQRTIFVFTSDNGATHSPVGGTDVDFFDSCGGLRGRKGSLHEGGVRVPAIVRWPGVVAAGSTCDRVTGFEDWLPTLVELCGGEAPAGVDGVNFAPTLRGEAQPPRPMLYREFAGYGGWQAAWQGDLKLVRNGLQRGAAPFRLYDLANDPQEERDLAAERADFVERLAMQVTAQREKSAVFPIRGLDGD